MCIRDRCRATNERRQCPSFGGNSHSSRDACWGATQERKDRAESLTFPHNGVSVNVRTRNVHQQGANAAGHPLRETWTTDVLPNYSLLELLLRNKAGFSYNSILFV